MGRRVRARGLLRSVVVSNLAVAALASPTTVGASASSIPTSKVASVWTEPQAGYGFLDSAISAARSSVLLSMYELKDPVLERALVARARAHVDVQVLLNYDYLGHEENSPAMALLRAGGVHAQWAPSGQIFHAKYAVIDRSRLYVGSGNLVASDYPSTRDFWVEDLGAGDVRAATATFLQDFAHAGASPRASGGLVWSPGSTTALGALISSARHSLLVENEEMKSAAIEGDLMGAARRGVRVDVVMTRDPSWTGALARLAGAGVHVRLLSSSQVYIHAKVLCADCGATGGTVFIGSENFSTSSLSYNRELGVVTTSPTALRAVRDAVLADFALGAALVASPTGTTTPPSGKGLTVTSIIATIARGNYESLRIHDVAAHQTCVLSVTLPSGYQSQAKGLGSALTDASGNASWSWDIGTRTTPGVAHAVVTCANSTVTKAFTITA